MSELQFHRRILILAEKSKKGRGGNQDSAKSAILSRLMGAVWLLRLDLTG
jgi:hypothetical protein